MKQKPRKIMIFGRPGSGKSTYAHKLHKKTNMPLYHLDKFFYKVNWQEQDYEIFLTIQKKIIQKDTWIIDGNNTKTLEMRYSQADVVLYFNYSIWTCLYRIFKRLFTKNKHIDDRAQGCSETIGLKLIKYMWSFEKRVEQKIRGLKKRYPSVTFIEINSNKQLEKLEIVNDCFSDQS